MEKTINIWIKTLGCKANLADSASVLSKLDQRFNLVDKPDQADIVLFNTCTVTHKAQRDVRKILNGLKRDFPSLPVVITGCAATLDPEQMRSYHNVSAVHSVGESEAIAASLGSVISEQKQSPFEQLGRKRAFAKVQDGCNSACAYCVIPHVRGKQVSVELQTANEMIRQYLAWGHREIVLTGIHLGRWGSDLRPKQSLATLLGSLHPLFADQTQVKRLRLSSIEPLEFTPQLIAAIDESPFVCRHFHLPLQSGDNALLRKMERPYQVDDYQNVIEQLRARFGQASIGADIMVGFPGESDTSVSNTLEFVKSCGLSYLHVFTFSKRPNTKAQTMSLTASANEIKDWAKAMRDLGQQLWRDYVLAGLGSTHWVLFEGSNNAHPVGRSEHYREVELVVCDRQSQPGSILQVKAIAAQQDRLLAHVV